MFMKAKVYIEKYHVIGDDWWIGLVKGLQIILDKGPHHLNESNLLTIVQFQNLNLKYRAGENLGQGLGSPPHSFSPAAQAQLGSS